MKPGMVHFYVFLNDVHKPGQAYCIQFSSIPNFITIDQLTSTELCSNISDLHLQYQGREGEPWYESLPRDLYTQLIFTLTVYSIIIIVLYMAHF